MQQPSPAEPAASEPDFSESEPRTTEAEEALIRAAARQILQEAEAEPIPEHLRKLATELAEALQKQRVKGEVSPSGGDGGGGPTT